MTNNLETIDCSKISKEVWFQLEQSTDYLDYATYGYEKSLKQMEKFEKSIQAARSHDSKICRKLAQAVKDTKEDFDEIREDTDDLLSRSVKTLSHRLRKFKRSKSDSDEAGFEGFDNLLNKVREMGRTLYDVNENWQQTDVMLKRAESDHQQFVSMKKKLEELRFRWTFTEVSVVLLNSISIQSSLYHLFSLPSLLTCLIFKPTTSDYYSSILVKTNKRLIRFIHALIQETNPNGQTIQELNNIVRNGIPFKSIGEDEKPIIRLQAAEKKETVNIPVRSPVEAKLVHGEVTAPPEPLKPIAKDSQITLLLSSNVNPKPCSTTSLSIDSKNSKNQ